jgi:hypothetical protein
MTYFRKAVTKQKEPVAGCCTLPLHYFIKLIPASEKATKNAQAQGLPSPRNKDIPKIDIRTRGSESNYTGSFTS